MALTFPQLWVHLWLLGRRYLPPLEHLQQSRSPTELWAWFCSMLHVVVSWRSLNIVHKNCVCFIDALQFFHARKEGFLQNDGENGGNLHTNKMETCSFPTFETFENLAMKSKGTRDQWPATWKLQGAGLQLLWGRPALWALDAKVEGLVPWRGAEFGDVGSGQKNTPPAVQQRVFFPEKFPKPHNRKKHRPEKSTIFIYFSGSSCLNCRGVIHI